ncbi:hypothetical protein BH10ACI2_BH10ACI2_21840 [soil metagenome]
MKINALNLGFASAIAIAWVICYLFVWMIPGPAMNMTGQMMQMDMGQIGWVLSPMGFIWGLVAWSVVVGIFAGLLATIYNRLTRS